jgi:CubicO group peptidase (beta-lactamase class C family)
MHPRWTSFSYSLHRDKFIFGSISKMFTAIMTFQLIEDGKLTLTTTVDKYFPQLPNANKITISNLLNPRSWLHNFTAGGSRTFPIQVMTTKFSTKAHLAKGETVETHQSPSAITWPSTFR